MMSRLAKTKQNSKMARLNITSHIANLARRNKMTPEDAVTLFFTNIRTGNASPYLIGASKIADPYDKLLNYKRVVRWVKRWQKDVPNGQQAKARKTTDPKIDAQIVAEARREIILHILSKQKRRNSSARKEIDHFIGRLKVDKLPNYLRIAVKNSNARPGKRDYVGIARCTIEGWMRVYRKSGNNLEALKPLPSSVAKPPYANDNNQTQKKPQSNNSIEADN